MRLNFNEAPQMIEPTTCVEEKLLLRGIAPLTMFDVLLDEPKRGNILNHFDGAWWRLLPDGRFFFEPARLNDQLSTVYIFQGAYREHDGSFILQAESYRNPENLLALEAIIRPQKGRYHLDCLFFNEGSESPVVHFTQSLTTENRRGMFYSSQTVRGVPVPALYDLELAGQTTSGSFSGVQACLYTAAAPGDLPASEPGKVHFSISNGSVLEAAGERNGTCMLLLPLRTMMDAAIGTLPSDWRFDLTIEDGHIKLNIEDIASYQSAFSWCEVREFSTEEAGPQRSFLTFCEARNLSLNCRVRGDVLSGRIRADGATQTGEAARYEATVKGRRASDAPQRLVNLEQKIAFNSRERSWQDTHIFHGVWHSERFGQVRLRQRGQTVTGTFSGLPNGTIKGTATEHRMIFTWTSEQATGDGLLHAARGGQFLAGFFSQPDSPAPVVLLLSRAVHSSGLVRRTLRAESSPLEWSTQARSLKSLNRHEEALVLYRKAYEAFGETRRELPLYSEAWGALLSEEWSALLDFMNCSQMQKIHLMNVHPRLKRTAREDAAAFDRLLLAFEYAVQLQSEIYALAQKVEAAEGVVLPDFGARLSGQIEAWRRSLRDEASRLETLESSQQSLAKLLKVLVAARSYKQALVVAESARARAFSDLMQTRIYREQTQASLRELIAEDVKNQLVNMMATTAPVELEMLEQTARCQQSTIVEYALNDDDLFAWVLSPDGEINFHQHHQKALRQSLTDLLASTRTSLGVQSRDAVRKMAARSPQQFLPPLTELYQLLVGPLTQWLPKNEHEPVVFIPSGILFMVPFPALFDKQVYIIERYSISVAPSIRFVETTYQLAAMRKNYPPGLMVVGDPLMPLYPRGARAHARRLPQLEFARREAEQIASKLEVRPLLGAEANGESVRQLLPLQKLIHLATHGLLDDVGPATEIPGAIALAPTVEDDGFLTATQIAALHLQARLVVMSACNTGRGRLSADGLLGLVRAFLTAGAECVVASLWSVPDHSTQELMVEFYENLLRGRPIAQALRQAMLTLKADQRYANPLDWAAFTVTGQSQRPLFDVSLCERRPHSLDAKPERQPVRVLSK